MNVQLCVIGIVIVTALVCATYLTVAGHYWVVGGLLVFAVIGLLLAGGMDITGRKREDGVLR